MRPGYRSMFVAAFIFALLAAGQCAAEVYVHDYHTGYIHRFEGVDGVVVNPDTLFYKVRGMSLDEEGKLILAGDMNDGSVLRFDPDDQTVDVLCDRTGSFHAYDAYPDASPDIYLVKNGGWWPGEECHPELMVLYGGVGPAQTAVPFAFSQLLLDVQVSPMGENAGNILVLTGVYPKVLAEVRRTGPTSFERIDDILDYIPGHPTGFAITPEGEIIVLDSRDGMFLVVDGNLEPFGSVSGPGLKRIAIGSDGMIYITSSRDGTVKRFHPDGSPLLPDIEGLTHPEATVAPGFTPTPPGQGVPAQPLVDVMIVFEEVLQGGYTVGSVVASPDTVSPAGNYLPGYVEEPYGDQEGFSYITLESGAIYRNLIQIDVYNPGSRLFHAHGTGQMFRDVTVEGSWDDARGIIGRFSEVVLVEDTRELPEVIDSKFARFHAALDSFAHAPFSMPCAFDPIRYVRRRVEEAEAYYNAAQIDDALATLAALNEAIRDLAGVCIPDTPQYAYGNVSGDLLAISKTLMFSLGLAQPEYRAPGGSAASDISLSVEGFSRGRCAMVLTAPSVASLTVHVYDVSGRLVDTLREGGFEGGTRSIVWDGKDGAGNDVASGVYFARVTAGDSVATEKLILVR